MIRQNLHTHTRFCDGADTPEELVLAALEQGLDSLGFSGHTPFPSLQEGWVMGDVPSYRAELLRLREKYAGQLEILLGLEQDIDSLRQEGPWDYIIGSVHGIRAGGELCWVDDSPQTLERVIREHFSGEPAALAEAYFRRVGEVAGVTGCRIVGHFDLLTKFDEKQPIFRADHPRYIRAGMEALDALAGRGLVFEINTGAMARGWRTAPYPAATWLRELSRRGERICITSDCHDRRCLTFGFAQAAELARSCGFRETWVLRGGEFVPQVL